MSPRAASAARTEAPSGGRAQGGRHVAQRGENERPVAQLGVRQHELGGRARALAIEQQVQIERPRPPAWAVPTPRPALEEFEQGQQRFWLDVGSPDERAVEEPGLRPIAERLGFVEAPDPHGAEEVPRSPDRFRERELPIAEVASEADRDSRCGGVHGLGAQPGGARLLHLTRRVGSIAAPHRRPSRIPPTPDEPAPMNPPR